MKSWLADKSKYVEICIVVLLWAATIVSRLKFNGLVYGLDFGLFHPDGSLYSMQSLIFSGASKGQANDLVNQFYFTHASKHNIIDASVLYDRPNWQEYKLRFLYPILSVPFIKIFGMYGMLVVPALSFLALLLLPIYIGHQKKIPLIGLPISACLISSPTITRWMFVNTSDSLLVLSFTLVVLALISIPTNSKLIATLVLLVITTSLTRFSLLIWIAIAIVLFLLKNKLLACLLIVVSFILAIPVFLVSKSSSILPSATGVQLQDRILQYPIMLLKYCIYEIGELFVLDKLLLSVLAIVSYIALTNLYVQSSKYFLATMVALILTGSLNGVLGVNFRYQLPLIPFIVWVAIDAISRLRTKY